MGFPIRSTEVVDHRVVKSWMSKLNTRCMLLSIIGGVGVMAQGLLEAWKVSV